MSIGFNDIILLGVYLIMCLIINRILANFQLSDIEHQILPRAETTQTLPERSTAYSSMPKLLAIIWASPWENLSVSMYRYYTIYAAK